MERNQKELSLYIMDLKIAKEIKENTTTNFFEFRSKIQDLQNEKSEIYNDNQQIINKVLNEYLKDVKKGETNGDERKIRFNT